MNPPPSSVVGEAAEDEGASAAASISPTTPNIPAVSPAAEESFLAPIHDVAPLIFTLAADLHKSGTSRRLQALGFCFMVPAQVGDGAVPDLNLPPPELIRKIKSRCIFQFTDDFVTSFLAEHGTPEESAAYAAMKSGVTEARQVLKADSIGISNMLFLSQSGKIEHALKLVDQALVEALDQLEDLNVPTPQEQVHAPPPDYKAPTQDDAAGAAVANQKLPDCVGVVDDDNLVDGDEGRRQDLKRKAVDDGDLQIIDKKAAHGGNLGIDA